MGDQIYHVAGYAKGKIAIACTLYQRFYFKDYEPDPPVLNGRMVEKWVPSGERGDDGEWIPGEEDAEKIESEAKLFNYITPEVFIVDSEWKKACGL